MIARITAGFLVGAAGFSSATVTPLTAGESALFPAADPLRSTSSRPPAVASPDASASIELREIKRLVLPFFSGVDGRKFARFSAEHLAPATRNQGPFRLPSVGFTVAQPQLRLFDTACTPQDWTRLLQLVALYSRLPSSDGFELHLPDGSVVRPDRRCRIEPDSLTAVVSLHPSGERQVLLIRHDGINRLIVQRRVVPRLSAFFAVPSATPDHDPAPLP